MAPRCANIAKGNLRFLFALKNSAPAVGDCQDKDKNVENSEFFPKIHHLNDSQAEVYKFGLKILAV
jgi:hypothetical protein